MSALVGGVDAEELHDPGQILGAGAPGAALEWSESR